MASMPLCQPDEDKTPLSLDSEAPAVSDTDAATAIIEDLGGGCCFVAHSRAMRDIRDQIDLIAGTSIPVLILGENGTGKEAIARLIHRLSLRASRTFMKVNCAALPAELLESELFGFEAGAFTGATRAKMGKFEACHHGTILMDEIAEMPMGPQAKLLHVLQDGEFARLGNTQTIQVDVRVLAATNVNIDQAIAAHKFRQDLYYRLNTFTIDVPPLRRRKADIPILLDYFIARHAKTLGREPLAVSPMLLNACVRCPWPGNVRQLENLVKHLLIVRDEQKALSQITPAGQVVSIEAAGDKSLARDAREPGDLKSLIRGLKQNAEKVAIISALEFTHGNRKQAARILKISLRALLYKIREYNIGADRVQG